MTTIEINTHEKYMDRYWYHLNANKCLRGCCMIAWQETERELAAVGLFRYRTYGAFMSARSRGTYSIRLTPLIAR